MTIVHNIVGADPPLPDARESSVGARNNVGPSADPLPLGADVDQEAGDSPARSPQSLDRTITEYGESMYRLGKYEGMVAGIHDAFDLVNAAIGDMQIGQCVMKALTSLAEQRASEKWQR